MSFGSTTELPIDLTLNAGERFAFTHSSKTIKQTCCNSYFTAKKPTKMDLTVCLCPLLSPVANKNGYSLQAALIFLYLSLAAWAVLRNELSQMFALGFTCHSLIVPIVIHPLRHVAAAGRIMGLKERDSQPQKRRTVCAKPMTVLPLIQPSLTSGKLQLKQDIQEHLEQAAP